MITQPDYHFRIPTEVRASTIVGADLGLFALEDVPAGRLVGMDFPLSKWLASEEQIKAQPPELRKYSWRHVEHVYFAAPKGPRAVADFLNHSFEPNLLFHVGCYFSRRDIATGDELLVDYQLVWAPGWSDIVDGASGRLIDGVEWREALRRSCRELLELLDG